MFKKRQHANIKASKGSNGNLIAVVVALVFMTTKAVSDPEKLLLEPTGLLKQIHQATLENGEKVSLKLLLLPREIEIEIGCVRYRVASEYSSKDGSHIGWKLSKNDQLIARAEEPFSLWLRRFKIKEDQFSFELVSPGFWTNRFDFVCDSKVIGSIKGSKFNPAMWDISVTCPLLIPLHLQLLRSLA